MDAVLSYHMSPLTCGVAKFNHTIARKMAMPMIHIFDPAAMDVQEPLISIKVSEFEAVDRVHLETFFHRHLQGNVFDLFLHDYRGFLIEKALVASARKVFCGNKEISAAIQAIREEVVTLWAPGMVFDRTLFHEADISLFTFGMAHKIRTDYFRKLAGILASECRSYRLFVSSALHEGTSFEGSFSSVFTELEDIFPQRVYFLGFLSDMAVFNILKRVDYFVAFFPKGVRTNNTSVHAAMSCGATLISNLDAGSPSVFVHGENMLDISKMQALPHKEENRRIGQSGEECSQQFGWDTFLSELTK